MNAVKMVLTLAFAGVVMASAGHAAADGDKGDKVAKDKGDKHGGTVAAPELASKGAPAALALVLGGVAIVVARRRRAS